MKPSMIVPSLLLPLAALVSAAAPGQDEFSAGQNAFSEQRDLVYSGESTWYTRATRGASGDHIRIRNRSNEPIRLIVAGRTPRDLDAGETWISPCESGHRSMRVALGLQGAEIVRDLHCGDAIDLIQED